MAEAIEKAVLETKAKSDENEEEGVTENTLPVTEPEEDVPKEDHVARRKRPNQSGAPRETSQQQQQEELSVGDEEQITSHSSKYETDTSDDDYFEVSHRTLKKPTFVSKATRTTVMKNNNKKTRTGEARTRRGASQREHK